MLTSKHTFAGGVAIEEGINFPLNVPRDKGEDGSGTDEGNCHNQQQAPVAFFCLRTAVGVWFWKPPMVLQNLVSPGSTTIGRLASQ